MDVQYDPNKMPKPDWAEQKRLEDEGYPTEAMIDEELERQATGCPPTDEEVQADLDAQNGADREHDEYPPYNPDDFFAGTIRDEDEYGD